MVVGRARRKKVRDLNGDEENRLAIFSSLWKKKMVYDAAVVSQDFIANTLLTLV